MNQAEILKKFNLDWEVRAERVITESGIELPQIALIRDDTNQHLSTRGDGYEIFQNEQLIDLLFQISKRTSLDIHRGGFFSKGEKVYIQLKSNNLKLGNDIVEGYLTGINSFDGSTSLAFGTSNTTISCQNKFFSVFKNLENKVRHSKTMVQRIDAICRQMDSLLLEEQEIFGQITRMSEERYKALDLEKVLDTLFKPTTDENMNNGKRTNSIERFMTDLEIETKQKGENLWGLFSGVTRYTTHTVKTKDNIENKMFGRYGEMERKLFNHFSLLV
jgi:hypothetical protein